MARPSSSPQTHHTNPNATVKDKLLHTLPCTFFLTVENHLPVQSLSKSEEK